MADPDLALVNAIARGDHEAFESLVKRYQVPLLNFIARYLGDRSIAEDLTQEAFLRVFRAASGFQARSKVSTWIFHIVYNLALNELGRRRRHEDLCRAVTERVVEDAYPSPGARYEEEEIMKALDLLPENQRAALLLRVKQEFSYQEIGKILGVSVQSVESLLFRARTSLKRYLEEGIKG